MKGGGARSPYMRAAAADNALTMDRQAIDLALFPGPLAVGHIRIRPQKALEEAVMDRAVPRQFTESGGLATPLASTVEVAHGPCLPGAATEQLTAKRTPAKN